MVHKRRTRFAPSPTGMIHLGNTRTALFNWLEARAAQGDFLLRIEDTDATRSEARYVDALKEDLRWLGLVWDEGPDCGGPHAPYFQSQRTPIYQRYFDELEQRRLAYPCFCTDQELNISRKIQRASGHPPRYTGTCLRLSAAEVAAKKARGVACTLRFQVPNDGKVLFEDLVRCSQEFACHDIGDFIIRRSDGTAAFFFSNAIDDSLMQVTHVLRGEDHLANTPRQLLLLKALNLPAPQYGHISMIVSADGGPLSKRKGSASVRELRAAGFLPLALLNYLARLGHHYPDDGFRNEERLIADFSLTRLGRSAARYEETQLMHWQHQALMLLTDAQVWDWLALNLSPDVPLETLVPAAQQLEFVNVLRKNMTLPKDGQVWAANLFCATGHFDPAAGEAIKTAGKQFFVESLNLLREGFGLFERFSADLSARIKIKGKPLFRPLRAVLSGETYNDSWPNPWEHGPQLVDLWQLLGRDRVLRRFELAATLAT